MKRMSTFLAGVILCVFVFGMQALASSGTVVFSDHSISQGDSVTVTMTVTCHDNGLGSVDATLVYDSSILQYNSGSGSGSAMVNGGSGSINLSWYDAGGPASVSFSFNFTAIGSGNATVSASYIEAIDIDETEVSLSTGYSAVNVAAPVSASSEARLSSMQISPGVLSPSFSPDVYTYNTSIGADVQQLAVAYQTMDPGASVSVWGTWMDPGANSTTLTVTAPAGNSVTYTIYTDKAYPSDEPTDAPTEAPTSQAPTDAPTEAPSETDAPTEPAPVDDGKNVQADGVALRLVESLEGIEFPAGFSEATTTYRDMEIPVARDSRGLELFYLTKTDGSGGAWYVHLADSDLFYPYVQVPASDSYVILRNFNSAVVPAGFTEMTQTINGQPVQSWVLDPADENREFFLVYAMNASGDPNFYSYDSVEGTFQRFTGELSQAPAQAAPAVSPAETQESMTGETLPLATPDQEEVRTSPIEPNENARPDWMKYLIIGLIAAAAIVAITAVILWRRGKGEKEADVMDENDYEDSFQAGKGGSSSQDIYHPIEQSDNAMNRYEETFSPDDYNAMQYEEPKTRRQGRLRKRRAEVAAARAAADTAESTDVSETKVVGNSAVERESALGESIRTVMDTSTAEFEAIQDNTMDAFDTAEEYENENDFDNLDDFDDDDFEFLDL